MNFHGLFDVKASVVLYVNYIYHGQQVNKVPHVTLTGWLLTDWSNVNKKNNNNPFMAAYEINLKRELTLIIE